MNRFLGWLMGPAGGRWALAVLMVMAVLAVKAAAQAEVPPEVQQPALVSVDQPGSDAPAVTNVPQLTSTAAVIAFAIFGTFALKKVLVNVPVAQSIPIWVYVSGLSVILTLLANQVFHTLNGDLGSLIWDGLYTGASATGIREWVYSGVTKPLDKAS